MIRRTFPVLVAVLTLGSSLFAQEKLRVYVKPADVAVGGFVDEETKRIADSRDDFLKQFRKTKAITLVDDAATADVTLQVASSARETFGTTSTSIDRLPGTLIATGTTTEESRRPTVRVKLTAGEYETEIAEGAMNWKLAAVECVRKVRRWIEDNKATLIERRAK
jgi:hypothetical protein